jgi:hypothetical protein
VSKIGNGNANVTLLLEFEGGKRFVFKPRLGEDSFMEAGNLSTTHVHFVREVEAYPFIEYWAGNALNKGRGRSRVRVPKTAEVVLTVEGKAWGPGSLQAFEGRYTTLKDFIAKQPDDWERIRKSREWKQTEADVRALDYVMGNIDRFPNTVYREGNFGNLLVPADMKTGDDIEIILIDNGWGRPGYAWFHVGNLSPGISEALRQSFRDFDAASFRKNESKWLPVDGIEDIIYRVGEVRKVLDSN